ncbi:hypothetical protein RQP46_003804 [Phenoliferia psychrophenolica]
MKTSLTLLATALLCLPSSSFANPTAIKTAAVARRTAIKRQDAGAVSAAGGIGVALVSTGVVEASAITVSLPAGALAAGSAAATSSAVAAEETSSAPGAETSSAPAAESSSAPAAESSSAPAAESSSAAAKSGEASSTAEASATSSAAAAEATKAAAGTGSATDLVVLNLALQLENLESQFYSAALTAFPLNTMVAAGLSQTQAQIIIEQLQLVQKDDSTHATVLTTAIQSLGGTPFTGCTFNFAGVLNDPVTFLSVARSLEQVGTSAYLGAASLLSDKTLLTAAGSILTLEARHQSLLNMFTGGSFAAQSFELALSPPQVLALAGGFLQNCNAADLSLTTNQPLSISERVGGTTRIQVGSQLNFASTVNLAVQASSLSCQMLVGGASVALVFPAENCVVPAGVNGPVAVLLTNSSEPLQANLLTQNTLTTVAGPGIIFVDSSSNTLSSLFAVTKAATSQNGQKQSNNKNSGALASADLGGYYVAMKNNGNTKSVQVVKETTTTTTTTSTVITENIIDGKKGQRQRMGRHRRHHAVKRDVVERRDLSGVKVVGWSKV